MMRSAFFAAVILLAGCIVDNPDYDPTWEQRHVASPDFAVARDLSPSCGRFVGDACCFAPPNLLVCDPGMECGTARTCEAVPDMTVIPDLVTPRDLASPPGTPGSVCDANSNCLPVDGAISVACEKNSNFASHCCWVDTMTEDRCY